MTASSDSAVTPSPASGPRHPASLAAVAALTYAALVLVMWLPFNPCGGMPYESHFLYVSEVLPWWQGFLFAPDPLRPHTRTFYHLSYLLGRVWGVDGSFVPFQIVYAVLWWARGLLVFLILRRFLPRQALFCFLSGLLVVAHASDSALMWVGQLNQFGFIFWMLLAFYLFVRTWQVATSFRWGWMAGSLAALHMSLWSYESQLLILLAAPLALPPAVRPLDRQRCFALGAWYVLPALYLLQTAYKYATGLGAGYQTAVMRSDWSMAALWSDFWANVAASLLFWRWPVSPAWPLSTDWLVGLSALGSVAGLAGGVAVFGLARGGRGEDSPPKKTWLALLAVSCLLLALSFPVYLLLDSAASMWRTQFLSGIGAALVWASLAGLVASLLPRDWMRAAVFMALGGAVCYCGVSSALRKAAFHDQIWSRHRQAMEQLLKLAPRLEDGTVVAATNVPKTNDSFGHAMWMTYALRLAYPGVNVAGVYFHDDGAAGLGNHLTLEGEEWIWDGTAERPAAERLSVAKTLAIRYDTPERAVITPELPEVLAPSDRARALYNPAAQVIAGTANPNAARRYLPCPQWWWTLSPGR